MIARAQPGIDRFYMAFVFGPTTTASICERTAYIIPSAMAYGDVAAW